MLELLPLIKAGNLLACRKARLSMLLLLLNIINEALEACRDFLNGNYHLFDAQVGETRCQIRAYKICLLGINNNNFSYKIKNLSEVIEQYKQKIVQVTNKFKISIDNSTHYVKSLYIEETKEQFLKYIKAEFILDSDSMFIILSHFLCKYCLVDRDRIPNAINYELIKQNFLIGSTPANNLANHYQSLLSSLSCDFIFEQLYYCDNLSPRNSFLFLMLCSRIGDRNRKVLPYYYGIKVLINSNICSSLPIIISIYSQGIGYKKHALFFKRNKLNDNIVLCDIVEEKDKFTPAIVFRGETSYDIPYSIAEFKANILQFGLDNIILLNAAAHPQYTGETLSKYSEEPYNDICSNGRDIKDLVAANNKELHGERIRANMMGCSRVNNQLFYIKHILCNSFYNECRE